MIWCMLRLTCRIGMKLVWLLMGFMLGVKVARSETINHNHNHNQSHVSYQEKQHHNSPHTKLEPGAGVDQQQNRRCHTQNDAGCLVALSNKTSYNQHMYQILNNGTLVINAQDMQTAIRFVQNLESGLDRATQHSPYTIRRMPQHGELLMS